MKNTIAKIAALTVLPTALCAAANAQSLDNVRGPDAIPAYRYSNSHETWHTVLLVSGILLLAGLINSDGGLILIGGAGVLVAESATNGTAYRQTISSFNLANVGRVKVGLNPFGDLGFAHGFARANPSIVFQRTIRF